MNPYTEYKLGQHEDITITRMITDSNDNVLSSEKISCETLGEAIDTIRRLFHYDKMMYECIKNKPYGLVATRDECVDNKFSYTMYICKREGSRKITAGIDNISKYAADVFCFNTDSTVTQQEK